MKPAHAHLPAPAGYASMQLMIAIRQHLLPYVDRLQRRAALGIELVVIHCTELPDMATARQYGEQIHYTGSNTGNCGHYYIDRDGQVEQFVPTERVAHHVRDYNQHSIGIELVNNGRYPNWQDSREQHMTESYPAAQIGALISLLNQLSDWLPRLTRIAGHQDLDQETIPGSDDRDIQVRRKLDPGPLFPWPEVLEKIGLTRWQP